MESRQPQVTIKHPLSQWLALRCKERPFWRFLDSLGYVCEGESAAIQATRNLCRVKSRGEIDRDPAAAFLFETQIRKPFAAFMQTQNQ